jgi:hypothetical protein
MHHLKNLSMVLETIFSHEKERLSDKAHVCSQEAKETWKNL